MDKSASNEQNEHFDLPRRYYIVTLRLYPPSLMPSTLTVLPSIDPSVSDTYSPS
jgi:hypothetical protein